MLVIGEKINILNRIVYESITSSELSSIVSLAILQTEAGADVLDINLGPDISRGKDFMKKLVTVVQEHVDIPLCFNGTPEIIEAGLSVHKGRAIINGVTGDRERMESLLPLARDFNARIIGMTLPAQRYAEEVDRKCLAAMEIIEHAVCYGISISDIYIDPVLSSFVLHADALPSAVKNINAFKETIPGIKVLAGLSNISLGINKKNRSVINSTALGVMIGAGLDAVIMNPLDRAVMDIAKTAKLLCNSGVYCDAYLCV